jgi:hypothetical protein
MSLLSKTDPALLYVTSLQLCFGDGLAIAYFIHVTVITW